MHAESFKRERVVNCALAGAIMGVGVGALAAIPYWLCHEDKRTEEAQSIHLYLTRTAIIFECSVYDCGCCFKQSVSLSSLLPTSRALCARTATNNLECSGEKLYPLRRCKTSLFLQAVSSYCSIASYAQRLRLASIASSAGGAECFGTLPPDTMYYLLAVKTVS